MAIAAEEGIAVFSRSLRELIFQLPPGMRETWGPAVFHTTVCAIYSVETGIVGRSAAFKSREEISGCGLELLRA